MCQYRDTHPLVRRGRLLFVHALDPDGTFEDSVADAMLVPQGSISERQKSCTQRFFSPVDDGLWKRIVSVSGA